MSKDSPTPTFPPNSNKVPTTSNQTNTHICEPVMAQSQLSADSKDGKTGANASTSNAGARKRAIWCEGSNIVSFTQRQSATYRLKHAAAENCRRHSADGATVGQDGRSCPGSGDADRFHPYRRQYSDRGATDCPPHGSRSFVCLREEDSPDPFPATHTSRGEDHTSWDPYNRSFQAARLMGSQHTYPEPPAATEEPLSFLSQSHTSYSPHIPVQHFSPEVYPASGQSNSSQYSLQCLTSAGHQDSGLQTCFPKPIYSYSILIFMALRNSKTGSLPVSEIYSFLTEHFPYFKTAPDGWKNSVRHNLSLNKSFQKVENKSGNSSRKGCLWALNPAKVEKMQEELHKWRRKDPLTVRKSMARPEDLDRLLGERPEKLKPLPAYHSQPPLARATPHFDPITKSSITPSQPQDSCPPIRRPLYPHVPPPSLTVSQHPHYLPPTTTPHPFPFYSPCGLQPSSGVPPSMGSLDSPPAGQTLLTYSASLQAEYGVGPRSMQELLLEGDSNNDIDTLNPSLTDLQIHGNLWEQLREDSLDPDSLVVITTSPPCSSPLPTPVIYSTRLGKREEEEEEEMGGGDAFDHHINGLYPTAYSGLDSLAGYLTSMGNTPIPLL